MQMYINILFLHVFYIFSICFLHAFYMFSTCPLHALYFITMFCACLCLCLFSGVSQLSPWADVEPCGLLQGLLLHALPAVHGPSLQTHGVGEAAGAVLLGCTRYRERSARAASKHSLLKITRQCYKTACCGDPALLKF